LEAPDRGADARGLRRPRIHRCQGIRNVSRAVQSFSSTKRLQYTAVGQPSLEEDLGSPVGAEAAKEKVP
jgi:hypothetical protein